jgi:hypothetical protein
VQELISALPLPLGEQLVFDLTVLLGRELPSREIVLLPPHPPMVAFGAL